MTTVVAVRKNGFVAIGADTQVTSGTTIESARYIRNHSKILRVGDSLIALTGPAAIGLALTSHFSKMARPPALDTPLAIFEATRELQTSLEEKYFLRPHDEDDDEFNSLRFDALIANRHGIFGLSALRAVFDYDRFTATGSGFKYALGAMYARYDTDSSAEQIARMGLEASAEFDGPTGLPIEVQTIPLETEI